MSFYSPYFLLQTANRCGSANCHCFLGNQNEILVGFITGRKSQTFRYVGRLVTAGTYFIFSARWSETLNRSQTYGALPGVIGLFVNGLVVVHCSLIAHRSS